MSDSPPPEDPSSYPTTISLPADHIEELIYFTRIADSQSLSATIVDHVVLREVPPATVVRSTIDIDADGLGSGCSILHYAAANGELEIVNYFLALLQCRSRWTYPVCGSRPVNAAGDEVVEARESYAFGDEDVAFVNHRNVSGNTALHWAAMNGHLAVVKTLVRAGADPTLANAAGRDAVVEAERSAKTGTDECVTWLLRECAALESGIGGGLSSSSGADEAEAEAEASSNITNGTQAEDEVEEIKTSIGQVDLDGNETERKKGRERAERK